ncbi:hypothetical protein E2320_015255 [Naja naja]|nr:hypothetical protein E2320_015255 [Naja naja]
MEGPLLEFNCSLFSARKAINARTTCAACTTFVLHVKYISATGPLFSVILETLKSSAKYFWRVGREEKISPQERLLISIDSETAVGTPTSNINSVRKIKRMEGKSALAQMRNSSKAGFLLTS